MVNTSLVCMCGAYDIPVSGNEIGGERDGERAIEAEMKRGECERL